MRIMGLLVFLMIMIGCGTEQTEDNNVDQNSHAECDCGQPDHMVEPTIVGTWKLEGMRCVDDELYILDGYVGTYIIEEHAATRMDDGPECWVVSLGIPVLDNILWENMIRTNPEHTGAISSRNRDSSRVICTPDLCRMRFSENAIMSCDFDYTENAYAITIDFDPESPRRMDLVHGECRETWVRADGKFR